MRESSTIIRSATCEVTGENFYVFLVTTEKQVMKFQTCIRQSVQRCQINRNRKVKESGIGSTPRIIVVSSVPGNFRIIITRVRVQLHDGGGGPQEDIRCITSMCHVLLQEVYCSAHSSCYLLTVVNCTRMTVTCCYDIYHDGIAISKS